MTYIAPYIDASGIHVPTYKDYLNDAIEKYKSIYGQDSYLEEDSQDYQDISTRAQYMSDLCQLAVLAYNNMSPQTAIGTGLASIIKLNGLQVKPASYSTCTVVLTGTAYTIISDGVISDGVYNWDLPTSVTLDSTGSATVTATCEEIGAITAGAGTLNQIVTPTYGWLSVTNPNASSVGVAVENDSQIRSRQAVSTSIAAQTLLESTTSAIADVAGVTRYRPYENTGSVTDTNGAPSHCIYLVIEGGADLDIANAINIQKNPGCGTWGTTKVNITDKFGNTLPISFFRPTYALIDVTVNLHALAGYNSTYALAIQTAITNYLETIGIGNNLTISGLWGTALSVMSNLSSPIFSITSVSAGVDGASQSTSDIPILFNQVVKPNTIIVNVS